MSNQPSRGFMSNRQQWWAIRLGEPDVCEDFAASTIGLATATMFELSPDMEPMWLHGMVFDEFEDGTSRIAQITHNVASLPGDDALTILFAIHAKVEGCDFGEIAAVDLELDEWLTELFAADR